MILLSEYSIPKVVFFILFLFICFTIILILLWKIYFSIKHPFWSCQPVFHLHYLHKWYMQPHIMWKNKYPITKYYNKCNVDVINLNILTREKQTYTDLLHEYSEFIKKYYIISKNNTYYYPTSDSLHLYLNNNSNPSYIGYYYTYKFFFNDKGERIFYKKKHSILSFRNICLFVNETKRQTNTYSSQIELYYVDYLCTEKDTRKKGYTPQLIYTAAATIANSNDQTINTFLFKREGVVHGIVPLLQYRSYLYNMEHWKNMDCEKDIHPMKITEIKSENFELFVHSLNEIKREMSYIFLSNIQNIKQLIVEKKIHAFILHHIDTIYSLFIFKNADYLYSNKTTLELSSTWFQESNKNINTELYFNVFLTIINKLKQQFNYQYIIIEHISHTHILLKKVFEFYKSDYSYVSSYYMYNYIHPTIKYDEIFLCF